MSDPTSNSLSFPVYDPNDKRPLPEIIAEFYGFPLAYVDDTDGKRYYAVQDWIKGVGQVTDVRQVWHNLKMRNPYVKDYCRKAPYKASNGKIYAIDHSPTSGIIEITQRMGRKIGIVKQ